MMLPGVNTELCSSCSPSFLPPDPLAVHCQNEFLLHLPHLLLHFHPLHHPRASSSYHSVKSEAIFILMYNTAKNEGRKEQILCHKFMKTNLSIVHTRRKFSLDPAIVCRVHPEQKLPTAWKGDCKRVKYLLGVNTARDMILFTSPTGWTQTCSRCKAGTYLWVMYST